MFDFCWLALLIAAYLKAQMGRKVNCQDEQMAFQVLSQVCTFPFGKWHPCCVHFFPVDVKRLPRPRLPAQDCFLITEHSTGSAAVLAVHVCCWNLDCFITLSMKKKKHIIKILPESFELENRVHETFISYEIGFLMLIQIYAFKKHFKNIFKMF
jgi:hypothetical protein